MFGINNRFGVISGSGKAKSSSNSSYIFTLLIVCLLSKGGFAQFTIDAQYRNRFELRDGYKKLAAEGSTPAAFISQRTRISFIFENENLKLKFTPQNVRVWGDEQLSSSTGVFGDYASLDLFEAFVQLKTGQNGWLSVGRQQLVYDNQRIFAARNWNQNGIAYDAVVYKLKTESIEFHAGSSWNSTGENASDNFYNPNRIKSLNFIWAKHQLTENWNLSYSHVASGVTKSETENKLFFRQTTGVYSTYKQDGLTISGNLYYQFGKNNTGKKVSAWLADADFSYTIGKITPGIGVSYLSGNKHINGKTDHLFDVLYGGRHRFFGGIDYFSSFNSHTKQGGLADYYFYFNWKLSAKISLKNTGHFFSLAQTNENTPISKNLGYENDLVLKHKFSNWGALESGYSFFLPTNALKTIQNVPETKFSQFLYLQLTVTPVLFKN
ncbi:Alginate export [Tangfeifania diversioriginum]|uniref:Alginate export n=1 Tax=Tangfeifania diversioriginum TaxID=1168035 RepID=A0A1M6H582_9BACT|nr:alginate export family protein [Tangfeifania diversioriginum]SHJ17326.1 Alginate export [Tangfeifania diversioriginum]